MKTPVQLLIAMLAIKLGKEYILNNIHIFEAAIELEKHQIIETHGKQLKNSIWVEGEDYYNEIFNQ